MATTRESQLERLRAGDEKEWIQLNEYIDKKVDYRYSRNLERSELEDVAQTAKLSIWKSIHRFVHRGWGSFRGWQNSIINNFFLQVKRTERRRPELVGRGGDDYNEWLAQEEACTEPQVEISHIPAGAVTYKQLLLENLTPDYKTSLAWRDTLCKLMGEPAGWIEFLRGQLDKLLLECRRQAEIDYGHEFFSLVGERMKKRNHNIFLLMNYTVLTAKDVSALLDVETGTIYVTVGRVKQRLVKDGKK